MTEQEILAHQWETLVRTADSRDIAVLTNVNTFPVFHQEFTLPYLVVTICTSGYATYRYDLHEMHDTKQTLAVMQPGHIVRAEYVSEDYNQTSIVVSKQMYDEWRRLSGNSFIRFYQVPSFHYTDEQANNLNDAVRLLRTIAQTDMPDRHDSLLSLLKIFFTMVSAYSEEQVPNRPSTMNRGEELFMRFHDLLMQHYTEAREIAFYANKLCITPKYFSAIIYKATGIGALDWITSYVIMRAKMLLQHHRELSIQDVCYRIGFNEQAAFSRYFKRATGMTPSQFRGETKDK